MWKKVAAVVLLVLLAFAAGYVVGVAHVMRTVVCAERPAPADGIKSIPYPGMICDNCYQNYPDWWCWLGGCP